MTRGGNLEIYGVQLASIITAFFYSLILLIVFAFEFVAKFERKISKISKIFRLSLLMPHLFK